MKKLNITKEQYNKSRYFNEKYGKLEYVSESGKLFKTSKGQILKFNEEYEPLGRAKPRKPDEVTIRVHIEWGVGSEFDSDEEVEQWLDEVDLPGVVYIKIPRKFYDDDNVGLDLSSKLGKTFDGYVQDYDYQEVDSKRIPIGARIFYWRPETDIMEEF